MHPKSLFSRRPFAPEKVQCHLMWVKYAIKFRFEVSPPDGVARPPRRDLAGHGIFFIESRSKKLHPDHRGSVRLWGGDVHRIFMILEHFARGSWKLLHLRTGITSRNKY